MRITVYQKLNSSASPSQLLSQPLPLTYLLLPSGLIIGDFMRLPSSKAVVQNAGNLTRNMEHVGFQVLPIQDFRSEEITERMHPGDLFRTPSWKKAKVCERMTEYSPGAVWPFGCLGKASVTCHCISYCFLFERLSRDSARGTQELVGSSQISRKHMPAPF